MRRVALVTMVVAACGSNPNATDASLGDAGDAAGPPKTHLSFRGPCHQPIDEAEGILFPDAAASAQTSTRGLRVFNDGPYQIEYRFLLDWKIEGPDAAQFTFDPGGGTFNLQACGFYFRGSSPVPLTPGDRGCEATITFAPTTTGPKQAALHVRLMARDMGYPVIIDQSIALHGTGVGASMNVYASSPEIFVDPRFPSQPSTLLANASSSAIDTSTLTATGAFVISRSNCPKTLTPGGACDVELARRSEMGCPAGMLTNSAGEFAIPLRAWGSGPVSLSLGLEVSPYGRVRVEPLGQTCTGTCSYMLTEPTDLILTAEPDAGAHFRSWLDANMQPHPCGGSLTCSVPASSSSVGLQARFASPAAKTISIAIVGAGEVSGVDVPCSASCKRYVEPNTSVTLTATTQGKFRRWTGDCSGPSSTCSLGTVINDRAVTATFNP